MFTTLSYGAVNLNAATQDMYEYLWNNVLDYCDILILKDFSVIRKLIEKKTIQYEKIVALINNFS